MACNINHTIVDDEENVIVDGAKIICSQAQESGVPTRYVFLRIPDGHGSLENGHLCAHDETCAPITNIPPYSACLSPYYKSMLDYLGAWDSENHKYQEATKAYVDGYYYRPCLLSLLNRWMNVDDKSIVQNYLNLSCDFGFDSIKGRIELYRKEVESWAALLYSLRDTPIPINPVKEADIKKSEEVLTDYNKVTEYLKEIKEINKSLDNAITIHDYYVEDLELLHAKSQIGNLCKILKDLLVAIRNAFYRINSTEQRYKKESGIKELAGFSSLQPIFDEVKKWLEDKIEEVETLYEKIVNFNPDPHHLPTMKTLEK